MTGGKTRYTYTKQENAFFYHNCNTLAKPRRFQCLKCTQRYPIHSKMAALIHAYGNDQGYCKERGEKTRSSTTSRTIHFHQGQHCSGASSGLVHPVSTTSRPESNCKVAASEDIMPPVVQNNSPRATRYRPTYNSSTSFSQSGMQCPMCPETFRVKELQRQHIIQCCKEQKRQWTSGLKRNKQTSRRPRYAKLPLFECEDCGYHTTQQARLFDHKMNHNSTFRSFRCRFPNCKLLFKRKKKLKFHEETHLADVDKIHPCYHCGRRFGIKINAVAHASK